MISDDCYIYLRRFDPRTSNAMKVARISPHVTGRGT
jgi:hypothetical protein